MGNRPVYLDAEAETILENKRKEDPNFNYSEFIQSCLKNITKKLEDPLELQLEINKKDEQINSLKLDLEFLKDKLLKVKMMNDEKEQTEQIKKTREQLKKEELIKSYLNSFKTFYEISDELALSLAEEFYEVKENNTIFDFMKTKGLSEKEKNER